MEIFSALRQLDKHQFWRKTVVNRHLANNISRQGFKPVILAGLKCF